MKNKLFLTSMLVMLTAAPAFASTNTATQSGGQGQIAADSTAENCSGYALYDTNQERTSGTITYTANWTPQQCTITLNPNVANGGSAASNPSTLYTKYGIGVYRDSNRTEQMTTAQYGLITPPTGATVTTVWDVNAPTNPVTDQAYSVTPIADSTPTRAFEGFYENASPSAPGTQYINAASPYYIRNDGITVGTGLYESVTTDPQTGATSCPETIWYAKWGCATRSATTPTAPTGYTFGGWYNSANPGQNDSEVDFSQTANTCTTTGDTFHAKWDKNQYTVTYDCTSGTVRGSSPASSTTTDTATYDNIYSWLDINNTCEWTGHTPSSWTCVDTNNNPVSLTSGYWQIDDDVTCNANWGVNQITLVWDTDGGSAVTTPTTCNYGTSGTILPQQPTKTGYTFDGWTVTDWDE